MALEEDGFTMPAIKRCTSGARRLSESSTLAPKCSKHIMFLIILWYERLTAKIRKQKKQILRKFLRLQKWAFGSRVVQISRKEQRRGFKSVHGAWARAQQQKVSIRGLHGAEARVAFFEIYVDKVYKKKHSMLMPATDLGATTIIFVKN